MIKIYVLHIDTDIKLAVRESTDCQAFCDTAIMASKAAAAATAAKGTPKLHAPQPQAKVRIDYKDPLKTGYLSKAGKTNKSFKNRFFVLYKNFLVYYDDETKWRRDVTVERLESRKGAINLTGASVSIPSGDMGISYGFLLRAPHTSNKRDVFLLGSSSDGERTSWIEAFRLSASPKPAEDKKK